MVPTQSALWCQWYLSGHREQLSLCSSVSVAAGRFVNKPFSAQALSNGQRCAAANREVRTPARPPSVTATSRSAETISLSDSRGRSEDSRLRRCRRNASRPCCSADHFLRAPHRSLRSGPGRRAFEGAATPEAGIRSAIGRRPQSLALKRNMQPLVSSHFAWAPASESRSDFTPFKQLKLHGESNRSDYSIESM